MANDSIKLVTVVGVGALGSHLVQAIRNEKIDIKVLDFDRVESKNVMSQFYGKPSVGKLKVDGLKSTMDFLFKRAIATGSAKVVQDNIEVLIAKSGNLVVDALDNAASRVLVQQYVRRHGIPCVHGALAPDGQFGRVVWDDKFVIDSEVGVGGATCEDGVHLPFITLTSALLARAVQVFIVTGRRVGYEITPSSVFAT